MYNGVIKVPPTRTAQCENKVQMLTIEEVEVNGIITQQYTIKTHEFKVDNNLNVRDFDIKNLQAIGVLSQLQPTSLEPSIEKVAANAETANQVLEIIEEYQKEKQNGKQQQTQTEIPQEE